MRLISRLSSLVIRYGFGIVVAGCGSSTQNGASVSCDYRTQPNASVVCVDWSGVAAAQETQLQTTCAGGATWSMAACDHSSSLGGCRQVSGGITATTWFYSDPSHNITSANDVKQQCGTSGTYISP